MTKRFIFYTSLIGDGETPDEAWARAVEALSVEPGPWPNQFEVLDENDHPTEMWSDIDNSYVLSGRVRIEWTNLGEGICGEYNENNPDDKNFMRFYMAYWDELSNCWCEPQDNTYCTQVDASKVKPERLHEIARLIADSIKDDWESGEYDRKLQQWSWVSEDTTPEIH